MRKVDLYRYEDANGVVVITPTPRAEVDIASRVRLIAEEGCVLTNGETETAAIDIMLDDIGSWSETSAATEEDYINALEELGVSFNE